MTAIKYKPALRVECLKPLYTMRTTDDYRCEPKLLKLSLSGL